MQLIGDGQEAGFNNKNKLIFFIRRRFSKTRSNKINQATNYSMLFNYQYADNTKYSKPNLEIRIERVMLDRDIASLYETETKALNLAVKRNLKRFPEDFMFRLSREEFESLRFQINTLEKSDNPLRLQIDNLKDRAEQDICSMLQ